MALCGPQSGAEGAWILLLQLRSAKICFNDLEQGLVCYSLRFKIASELLEISWLVQSVLSLLLSARCGSVV